MRAVVLLADAASQEGPPLAGGKISALGLGWTVTITPSPPAAVIVLMYIPWEATNQRHTFDLELVDSDGNGVKSPTDPGPMTVSGSFEVGRPAGVPHGTEQATSFCVTVGGGIVFDVGQAYEWRLSIDGTHEPEWSARFLVRQQVPTIERAAP